MKLNHSEIRTFVGNIMPLTVSDAPLTDSGYVWRIQDADVAYLRTFDFENGCVLAFLREGTTAVTVEHGGETLVCPITVRARSTAEGKELHPYFADLHTHTTMNHDRETFLRRDRKEWAENAFREAREEGKLDAMAVTDHGCLVDDSEFFRTLLSGEAFENADFITFPGTESEVSEIETDAWGIKRKNSGEVVTFQACGYANCYTWADYFALTAGNPYTVGGFAHPQIYGTPASKAPGIWNFSLETKTTDQHRARFRFVELGNGEDRGGNLINEGVYSLALDCGYRLAPTMDSDCHETPWGIRAQPGRTVLWATEKSHEAFSDALLNCRFYATESGDVKLFYTVNGAVFGGELPAARQYDFSVQIGSFGANKEPTGLEVISDGGKTVYACAVRYGEWHFTVESDSASYFYLRLTDENGLRTWSAPIFTGRKSTFRAADVAGMRRLTGVRCAESDKVTNGNPYDSYLSDAPETVLHFDFGQLTQVRAMGYYPHLSAYGEPVGPGMSQETQSRFIGRADIYISTDGVQDTFLKSVSFRIFGGEQFERLDAECRTVKMVVTSVGAMLKHRGYEAQPVQVGEISFYQ